MDETPFPHYGPLEAQGVTGREEEAADLIGRLLERRPVALVGPRRYGKTSLVRQALVAARGRMREVLDTIAGGLSVQLGVLGVELRRPGGGRDPVAALHRLLDVLVRAAGRERVVLA